MKNTSEYFRCGIPWSYRVAVGALGALVFLGWVMTHFSDIGNLSNRPPQAHTTKRPRAESSFAASALHLSEVRIPNRRTHEIAFAQEALWQDQPEDARLDAIREIRDWAGRDLNAAIAWIHQLQDDDAWDALSSALCFQVSQQSSKAALEILTQFRQDARSCELAGAFLSCWAEKDPLAAIEWIDQTGDPAAHDPLLASALTALALHQPAAAVANLSRMAPGPRQDETLGAIIDTWASSDVAAAGNCVDSLTAKSLRQIGLERVQVALVREQTIRDDQGVINP